MNGRHHAGGRSDHARLRYHRHGYVMRVLCLLLIVAACDGDPPDVQPEPERPSADAPVGTVVAPAVGDGGRDDPAGRPPPDAAGLGAPDAAPATLVGGAHAGAGAIDAAAVDALDLQGRFMVFAAASPDAGGAIKVWNLGNDQIRHLAPVAAYDLFLSPDGTKVAAVPPPIYRLPTPLGVWGQPLSFTIYAIADGTPQSEVIAGDFVGWKSDTRILILRPEDSWVLYEAAVDGSSPIAIHAFPTLNVVRAKRWNHSVDRRRWVFLHTYYRMATDYTVAAVGVADPLKPRVTSTMVSFAPTLVVMPDDQIVIADLSRGVLVVTDLSLGSMRSSKLAGFAGRGMRDLQPWTDGRLLFRTDSEWVGDQTRSQAGVFTIRPDGTELISEAGLLRHAVPNPRHNPTTAIDRSRTLVFLKSSSAGSFLADTNGNVIRRLPGDPIVTAWDW